MSKRKGKRRGSEPEELPEEQEEETQDEGTDEPEADVEVRMRGKASAVNKAQERFRPPEPEPTPEEFEDDLEEQKREADERRKAEERDRKLAKAVQDPKNVIVVKRVLPKRYKGVNCTVTCDKYDCPQDLENIAHDIFERFGGKQFKFSIHAATAGGVGRMIDAIVIENPDENRPYDGEGNLVEPQGEVPPDIHRGGGGGWGELGFETEDDDAMAQLDKMLKSKTKILSQRMKLQELKETMRDLQEGTRREQGEGKHQQDDMHLSELSELKSQMAASQLQQQFNEKIATISRSVEKLAESMERGGSGQGQGDSTLTAITSMMNQQQQQFMQFTQMMMNQQNEGQKNTMSLMTELIKRPTSEDKVENTIELFAKLKEAMGGDRSKSARLEEMMYDIVFEKITGASGAGEEEGDVVKYAIKELSPILKCLVATKQKEQGRPLSDAEKQQAAREVLAQVMARQRQQQIAMAQQQQRQLPPAQQQLPPQQQPAATHPIVQPRPNAPPPPVQQSPVQRPAPVQQQPNPNVEQRPSAEEQIPWEPAEPQPPAPPAEPRTPPPPRPPSEPDADDNEEDLMPEPPGPDQEGYDRKESVNYILDGVLSEIDEKIPYEKPEESYVVGDCLSKLDDELLNDLLGVSSGTQLEAWLKPYGDPEMVEQIKRVGEEDMTIRAWLSRIVSTVKFEFQRKLQQRSTQPEDLSDPTQADPMIPENNDRGVLSEPATAPEVEQPPNVPTVAELERMQKAQQAQQG